MKYLMPCSCSKIFTFLALILVSSSLEDEMKFTESYLPGVIPAIEDKDSSPFLSLCAASCSVRPGCSMFIWDPNQVKINFMELLVS